MITLFIHLVLLNVLDQVILIHVDEFMCSPQQYITTLLIYNLNYINSFLLSATGKAKPNALFTSTQRKCLVIVNNYNNRTTT